MRAAMVATGARAPTVSATMSANAFLPDFSYCSVLSASDASGHRQDAGEPAPP
jgi:hypothetical protein